MEAKIEALILTPQSGAQSLKEKYELDIAQLGDKIHQLGLQELAVRENEVRLFEESVEVAQTEGQTKGVKSV